MIDPVRQEVVENAHTVVVKVGTRVVTHSGGVLNHERLAQLADELHAIKATGRQVVLVSSGAVGAGMKTLGLTSRPSDLAKLQAVAAIGQAKLIEAYNQTFQRYGYHAAQVLLIADDLNDRTRYLNVRNTLLSALEFGTIPIINENDTVSVEELMTTFGDNDRLAAMLTNLLRAPLLVIFSDIDGLYDGDPSNPGSKLITTVRKIDETILGYVRDKKTGLSKGGMASKLTAAKMVTSSGENVIIAHGHKPGMLTKIMAGEPMGTLFVGHEKALSPLKRWIGFSARPRGKVVVDTGAHSAITEKGRSLLAAGIVRVEGEFRKGDVVNVCDANLDVIARGLSNYNSADIDRIKGVKSEKIAGVLGHRPYEEVIHRDNLMVVHK